MCWFSNETEISSFWKYRENHEICKAICMQKVIKMELVRTENALLFMFYHVLMETILQFIFPIWDKTSLIFPIAKEGVVVKNSKKITAVKGT